jgi:hypothetical protein
VEAINQKMKEIEEQFWAVVGESHPNAEALKKIFMKHVKNNVKQVQKVERDESNYFSDGENEEENYDFGAEEDEVDEDDNGTPPAVDVDQGLFSKVIELRQQRLAQEEQKNDIKKSMEVIKKEMETLVKKEKVVSNSLTATENELMELQKVKQDKLNELDVVVTLKLNQYLCLNATDLSESLVFPNEEYDKLNRRIKQLQQELIDLRHNLKTLAKDSQNQAKEKIAKKAHNKQLEAKCIEVQILKFGQEINLEALEKKSVNKPAEELKERIERDEAIRIVELEQIEQEIKQQKTIAMDTTIRNTMLLQQLADLNAQQAELEEKLNSSQHAVVFVFFFFVGC